MKPKPHSIADADPNRGIVRAPKTIEQKDVQICGRDLCLTVTVADGMCPAPFKGEPTLLITGDTVGLSLSSSDDAPALVCKGKVVSFGKTVLEFSELPDRVTIDNECFVLGPPDSGLTFMFHDGAPVGEMS